MTVIHTPKADAVGAASAELNPDVESEATEVLFPEAKHRERRRRLIVLTTLLAVAGLTAGLIAAFGGSPPRNNKATTSSGNGGSPVGVAGHFTFRGNGIGTAQFGQEESVAIANLDKVFGTPTTSKPTDDAGNCTVDAYLMWPTMNAYFFQHRFVGYNSASLLQGTGTKQVIPSAATAQGLRIGNSLAQAKRIYGTSLTVSYAQGGSWFAKTSTGTLDGYLTAVPGHPTPPVPRIADISAGSVGCPAASP